MKSRRPSRIVLVVLTFICLLWSSQALAVPFYTFQGDVLIADLLNISTGDSYEYNSGQYRFDISKTANTFTYTDTAYDDTVFLLGLTATFNLFNVDPAEGPPLTIELPNTLALDYLYLSYSVLGGIRELGSYTNDGLYSNDPLNVTPFLSVYDNGSLLTAGFTLLFEDSISQYELVVEADNATAAPVPEPSTFLLFGIGLAGVGFSRRMKNRK